MGCGVGAPPARILAIRFVLSSSNGGARRIVPHTLGVGESAPCPGFTNHISHRKKDISSQPEQRNQADYGNQECIKIMLEVEHGCILMVMGLFRNTQNYVFCYTEMFLFICLRVISIALKVAAWATVAVTATLEPYPKAQSSESPGTPGLQWETSPAPEG